MSLKDGQVMSEHVEVLNPNECESESEVCIKLVVFITVQQDYSDCLTCVDGTASLSRNVGK
jgi:hypothetical protein